MSGSSFGKTQFWGNKKNLSDEDRLPILRRDDSEKRSDVEKLQEFLKDKGFSQDIQDINNKNNRGNTPLIMAVRGANKDVVELLLNAGAKVDIQNSDGKTALITAAEMGFGYIVKLLLDAGAVVDMNDNDGNTALITAVKNDYINVVALLVYKGVDVTIINNERKTALDIAKDKRDNAKNDNDKKTVEKIIKYLEDAEKNKKN
jgi:ankyrin repeat protein